MPLRAISTNTQNGGTAATITIPGSAVVGDLATLIVASNNAITTDLSGSGWTLIGSSPSTASSGRLTAWSKVVTTPDIGTTVNLSTAAATRFALAAMVRYDVLGFDVAPVFGSDVSPSLSPAAPSITASTGGVELVSVYGCLGNLPAAMLTCTVPGSQTEIADLCTPSGSVRNAYLAIGEETLATAGVSGTRTATIANVTPPNDARLQQGTLTLAFTPTTPPPTPLMVKVRQSGAWASRPLKVRSGGTWI